MTRVIVGAVFGICFISSCTLNINDSKVVDGVDVTSIRRTAASIERKCRRGYGDLRRSERRSFDPNAFIDCYSRRRQLQQELLEIANAVRLAQLAQEAEEKRRREEAAAAPAAGLEENIQQPVVPAHPALFSPAELQKLIPEPVRQLYNRGAKRVLAKFLQTAKTEAVKYDLPPWLTMAIITVESAGVSEPCPVSFAGAVGVMQTMPDTDEEIHWRRGVKGDSCEPTVSIQKGSAYLDILNTHYRETFSILDLNDVILAYYMGPKNISAMNRKKRQWHPYLIAVLYAKNQLLEAQAIEKKRSSEVLATGKDPL